MVEIIILVVLLLLVAVVLGSPLFRGRQRRALTTKLARYETISASLVEGDLAGAREALKELILQDTDDVNAYLRLARILRREGDLERSVSIYRSLLARELGETRVRQEIISGLVEDLFLLGRYREARDAAEQLRQLDRRHPQILQVELHEALEQQDWHAAQKTAEGLAKSDRGSCGPRAAQARVEIAARRADAGQISASRKILEEALRDEADHGPALLLLGDLHSREGDHEKAAGAWQRLLRAQPHAAALVVDRLEKAYFEMGRFSDLGEVYADLARANPSLTEVLQLARVRMALRRGEPEEALRLVEDLLDRDPNDLTARHWQLYLLHQLGRGGQVERTLKELLETSAGLTRRLECPQCHAGVEPQEVRCRRCGAWLPDPFAHSEAGECGAQGAARG